MIKKVYKQPVELHYYCDKCNTELKFTGEVLLSNPEKYVHICSNCNKTEWLDKSYPCIVYEDRTIASDMFGSNFNIFK
jgi:hypothetical protein